MRKKTRKLISRVPGGAAGVHASVRKAAAAKLKHAHRPIKQASGTSSPPRKHHK